ncbi:hypothetical protein CJP06_28690 [Klebsiella pneumoniae]|nr:hypothetical protein CJP06_28690 [Klebsiella pneumoniae]
MWLAGKVSTECLPDQPVYIGIRFFYLPIFFWPETSASGCEPRQPGGCKLKTAPVRPVVAARPAEYVCSEDLFY